MKKFYFIIVLLLIAVYGCKDPDEPKKPCKCKQYDFADSIPPFSEMDYNSCMTVLKKYTCNTKGCNPPVSYLNEMGKKIKICGYVTELADGGFVLADDTVFNDSENSWSSSDFYHTHIIAFFGTLDKYDFPFASEEYGDNLHPDDDLQQYFRKEYLSHPSKTCYIIGEITYMHSPVIAGGCVEVYPKIGLSDSSNFYFE